MCTCVVEIRKEIAIVQNESASMLNSMSDKEINHLLDVILGIKRNIADLNKTSSNLYALLLDNFSDFSSEDSKMLKDDLKSAIVALDNLFIALRKSRWYSGIKTEMKAFRANIDNLKEIACDINLFKIELPKDDKFISIINQLNTL